MSLQIEERASSIKSIVKAAKVINVLSEAGQPLSLAKLSSELKMSKSTLHGIIATLVDVKFVVQEQHSGCYQLGTRLFEIGNVIASQWNVRKIAYPFIQQIVAATGETVHMAVLSDYEVLYINKLESMNSVRIVTDVGLKLPAHCTGLGKALLSGLSSFELQHLISEKGLKKHTDATITTYEKLWRELERIRVQGYATDEQEFVDGLRCVAAPVFNHAGEIAAALSISGPVSRMQGEKFEQCLASLQKAAVEISALMGYDDGKETYSVTFPSLGKSFKCRGDEYLYYALRKAGIIKSGGCRGGGCGICKVSVLSGQVRRYAMSSEHIKAEDEAKGMLLACRAKPRSNLVLAFT